MSYWDEHAKDVQRRREGWRQQGETFRAQRAEDRLAAAERRIKELEDSIAAILRAQSEETKP